MSGRPASEAIRFSVARDLGGIELIHARFHRRGLPPHWHEEYSIGVSLRGGLAFDHRGTKHSAPSGVISCLAPGEVHNSYSAGGEDWEFVALLVPTKVAQGVLEDRECRTHLPDLPRRVVADPGMANRLVSLYGYLTDERDVLMRQSTSLSILGDFFAHYSTAETRNVRTGAEHQGVRRALELLHERYAEPITLAKLAAHAGFSPFYFLRAFRASVGMTPHAYLNQIRVAAAKRRLAEGSAPAEAAIACGFCDQSHMSRQFKRSECVTPGDYQGAYQGVVKTRHAKRDGKSPDRLLTRAAPFRS